MATAAVFAEASGVFVLTTMACDTFTGVRGAVVAKEGNTEEVLAQAFFGRACVAIIAGRTFDQSPTTPNLDSRNTFAWSSVLTATMFLEEEHPAMCWLAPEIPNVRYRRGLTVLPVNPT